MPDGPYTDIDLITEAARQHHRLTQKPNRSAVLVSMDESGFFQEATSHQWKTISEEQVDAAHNRVYSLIENAANVSAWAIQLGADGLAPYPYRVDAPSPDGVVRARIHFAFDPSLSSMDRLAVISPVQDAIRRLCSSPEEQQ